MPTAVEEQFVHNYSKLLIEAWTDRGFIERLQAQPAQVLKEYGLPTVAYAQIDIIRTTQPEQASLEEMVREWFAGEQSGIYKLYIPQQPQLGAETSGATGEFTTQDTYCCCCCPCCTCT